MSLIDDADLADYALCWWPVAYLQEGKTGVACGKHATNMRVHPDCGCDTWLCDGCVVEFDEITEAQREGRGDSPQGG